MIATFDHEKLTDTLYAAFRGNISQFGIENPAQEQMQIREKNYIVAALNYPDAFLETVNAITKEDFLTPLYRDTFLAMINNLSGNSFNGAGIAEEITNKGHKEADLLALLNNPVYNTTDTHHAARLLMEQAHAIHLAALSAAYLNAIPGEAKQEAQAEIDRENAEYLAKTAALDKAKNPLDFVTITKDIVENPPDLKPVVIDGILRRGHKMIICAASKSGKSFLAMQLALCIANGAEWLSFPCTAGNVLYCNLEIDDTSAVGRFSQVSHAMHTFPKGEYSVDLMNNRGKGEENLIDRLSAQIIARAKRKDYAAIIVDPFYKANPGDENNAADMTKFFGYFDAIARETGAAVIMIHHYAKGTAASKSAQDRGSGSGVFARDADAYLTLSQLSLPDLVDASDRRPFRLEAGALREFKSFSPVNVWFEHPVFMVDTSGELENAYLVGSAEDKLNKSEKRKKKSGTAELIEAYNAIEKNGETSAEELAEYMGIHIATVRRKIRESNGKFINARGKVKMY